MIARCQRFIARVGRMSVRSVILACAVLAPQLQAQEPVPLPAASPQSGFAVPQDADGLMTLHVYTNLVQMPALVLSPEQESLPPIKPERFSLTLDGGPPYRPAKVRQEGDDPISLAILLDLNNAKGPMAKMDEAIAGLAPNGLTARDHVTIYAVHCGLVKTLDDKPADAAALRQAVNAALEFGAKPARSAGKGQAACAETFHLYDSIAFAANYLKDMSGRRVIVAVTDYEDDGSKLSWQQVANSLQSKAVALFGLRVQQPGTRRPFVRANVDMGASGTFEASSYDELGAFCERTGGMAITTNHEGFARQIARIPSLLRGRYILEFPRPGNSTAGNHIIDVRVAKSMNFIRVSGTSVPLVDHPDDPTTLPGDPTLTPQIGKRKTIPPPQ